MIDDLWFKNTVVYSLSVESFMDGNGDGIGDFEGLTRRLDYLASLGIGTIWLAPFQPSPMRDDGYDISDFYGVDPRYGSSGDFVQFMHEAEDRGIKVIIDLVINHTSDRHRWFQVARKNAASPYRDWYVWSKKRPPDWNSGMVFPGVQKSTWSQDKAAGEWYYHRFYDFQPDLNMDNPAVRRETRRIVGYWLELGIAGFRMDAVPFVIESTVPGQQGKLHFEYLDDLRAFIQWRRGDAILLGEANVKPQESIKYFGPSGDRINIMFNFWVNQHLFYALASGDVVPLANALEATREVPGAAQWAMFLRNHDELDLGRLKPPQRQRVFEAFGPDKEMQLYDRGIRRRLAPMLGRRRQLEMAYSLLFSLPGTPVLRYGEEIGMGDDLALPERYPIRTPMQWTHEPGAGFTTAARPVRPIVRGGPYGVEQVNVEAQRRDPNSLLNWMTSMIRLRKECPEVGIGTWTILPLRTPGVLALRFDGAGRSLLTLHNLGDKPCEVAVRPGVPGGERLVNLLVRDESLADGRGTHRIALEAYGYRWFRVGALDGAPL